MPHYDELLQSFSTSLGESQYWPHDRMQAYQGQQLEWLVWHARANSPFYEHRLDAVFRPDGSVDLARWRDIPILTRRDLAAHHDAMLARKVPAAHGEARDFMTSGSSGLPVTITATGIASLCAKAAEIRAFGWHGIDYSRVLCSILATADPSVATWPEGRRRGPWGPHWIYGAAAGRKVEINFFETYPHIVDFLKRSEADYLMTGPTVAYAIALESMRLGADIRLDRVMTYGSSPMATGNDAYRKAFGAGLLPLYSSKEAGTIAHTCPTGEHYHVHAENILLEILDENDKPCRPGETGRAVVTPFLSTFQPIIRYELGDLITVGEACSCGRTLPVLKEIAGRVSHVFRFPDGSSTYRRLPQELRARLKAGMWQVAQVAPLAIELRYEPLDWNDIGDEDGVAAFTQSMYHPDAKVTVKRVDKLPLTKAGKLIEYVYEVEA